MKNFKEKGITLVALVVTVIILLILAGVTINIALSENGLFKRAKESTLLYKNSSDSENEKLKELDKVLGEIDEEHIEEKFSLSESIGKEVNYDVDLDGDPSTYDWKIFYQGTASDGDANGRIFLIASDYINGTLLDINKEKTGLTGENGNYVRYWINAPTIKQSMNKNSILMTNLYPLETKSTENVMCTSTMLNTNNWEQFKDAKGYAEFAIGGPTLQMWCNAWNSIMPESGKDENGFMRIMPEVSNTEDYGYKLKSELNTEIYLYINGTQNQPQDYKILSSIEKYKVFFPRTIGIEECGCNGYWLSSPSASTNNNLMTVHFDGNVYSDIFNNINYGFRPIVCLNSNVKIIYNNEENIYKILLEENN